MCPVFALNVAHGSNQCDDLNRLVSQDEGIVVGGSIALSELERSYNMDLLGNLVASAGGFKQNSGSSTFTHAVNATNELTTITRGNPAGRSRLVLDDFASSLSAIWSQEDGDWSISGGKVNVDAKDGFPISVYMTRLMGSAVADDGSLEVKTTLPSGGGNAGLIFSKAGNIFWGVSIADGSSNNILLEYFGSSGLGQVKASTSATISVSTEYTIRVVRIQRHVDITIFDGASVIASLAYDSPTDFGDGTFGMWSTAVDAQFDDFSFTRLDQVHAPAAPRFASTAQTAQGLCIRQQRVDHGPDSIPERADSSMNPPLHDRSTPLSPNVRENRFERLLTCRPFATTSLLRRGPVRSGRRVGRERDENRRTKRLPCDARHRDTFTQSTGSSSTCAQYHSRGGQSCAEDR